MSEANGQAAPTPTPAEKPFLTLTEDAQGRFEIKTNLPPVARPVMLWMLEQAKLMILTKQPDQESNGLIKPANGQAFAAQMMKRIRG